jgi:hypothetical protein
MKKISLSENKYESQSNRDGTQKLFAKNWRVKNKFRSYPIRIPNKENSLDKLIEVVYGNEEETSSQSMILTNKNINVDQINEKIMDGIGDCTSYHSADSIEDSEGSNPAAFPIEFLNSLKLPGLPIHCLKLQIGTPVNYLPAVMLLRNLCPQNGLSNGTRLKMFGFSYRITDGFTERLL